MMQFKPSNLVKIYDKNPEIGGTWYENRYPGCACDVPSHNYTFSFDPNPTYSSVYAGSEEIKSYFEAFVSKHDLGQFIHTSHLVKRTVEAENLVTGQMVKSVCDILIHATGYLNKPAWPRVSGLDDFKGVKLHSADYDKSIDITGQSVLIIGGGSSAVQILPAIQPIVQKAKIVIRTPSWMLPDISTETSTFTPDQIREFVEKPEVLMALRQENERTMNSIFSESHQL
jgi:cation diffusion facilitator CzcD-associated flavoprotein CzcO